MGGSGGEGGRTVEEEADGWQPLDGPDEQFLETLAAALSVGLAQFQEGVEARLGAVARSQRLFRLLEKIDERRGGLHKLLRLKLQKKNIHFVIFHSRNTTTSCKYHPNNKDEKWQVRW